MSRMIEHIAEGTCVGSIGVVLAANESDIKS